MIKSTLYVKHTFGRMYLSGIYLFSDDNVMENKRITKTMYTDFSSLRQSATYIHQ